MPRGVNILIFSKDRALQLDALLRSLFLNCPEAAAGASINILFKSSSDRHAEAYRKLLGEMTSGPVSFIEESDFRAQTLAIVRDAPEILFLVDDTLFVKSFPLESASAALASYPRTLGVSLRLGRNIVGNYMKGGAQKLPRFTAAEYGLLSWRWTHSRGDFGYPLEISSSLYRSHDILEILEGWEFHSPSSLEALLASAAHRFRRRMPYLLCFPSSVAFSLPLNRVQQEMENACGRRIGYPADALADSFLSDLRVDLTAFSGFTPMSCHQETELPLVRLDKAGRERPDSRMNGFDSPAPITAISDRRPPVSVLMPARNAAAFVPAAIDSILEQTFADFELLIADDGSIDGTTEEIRRFTDPRIRCFRSGVPSGPAATRNELIDRARGEYLAMMDADDIAHPRRLEFQTSLMRRDPSIGVCGSLVRTFGSGRRFVQPYHLQHEEIFCDCLFESPVAQPACMLRSKVLGEHGIRYDASLRAAEDYDLFFRLLNVTRFENIPLILLDYRRHPAQTATVQSAALSSTRRIIHRCLIARLGIDATEAELDLHSAIADWKFPDDGGFPFNAHDWFIRLIEADRNAGVFEHTALRRLLADRFFAMTSFFAPRGNSLMSRLRALRLHREADAGARARAVQRVRGIFRAGIGQAAVI